MLEHREGLDIKCEGVEWIYNTGVDNQTLSSALPFLQLKIKMKYKLYSYSIEVAEGLYSLYIMFMPRGYELPGYLPQITKCVPIHIYKEL